MTKHFQKKLFFSLLCSTYLFPNISMANPFETSEYLKSAGLKYINASTAYDLGFTGKNILLGELDSGVLFRHQEFFGKTSLTLLPDYPNWDWNENNHGTHVAGIMLASKDEREMHGVAFNANLFAGQMTEKDDNNINATNYYKATFTHPELKIINNSWGDPIYLENIKDKAAFLALPENKLFFQTVKTAVLDHDKVFVFAAGNDGHMSPSFQAGLPYLMPEISGNWLNAMAFSPQKKTDEHGFVAIFTHLAQYVEENSLMAPGVDIYSSISRNTSNNSYENMSGTSMAAPFVTGSLGLVQEAFPYMNGKQLTDTILSTANKGFTREKFVVLYEDNNKKADEDGNPIPNRLNIIYFGAKPTNDETTQNLTEYYYANAALLNKEYSFPNLTSFLDFKRNAIGNVPWESVYGQGLLDVGKAVQGPGLLNARRLNAGDISSTYGNKQAIYNINTRGYNSVWRNDISEKTVDQGYIDHSERTDLKDLIGLSVGLQKDGLGTLALLGTNTYLGASIANGGTLQIDGSITGAAYSNPQGVLAGSGTLQNVFNRGTLQAGSWGQVGTMTIAGNLESSGNINVLIKDDTASMIKVSGLANIADSSLIPLRNKALTPNSKYKFMTANNFSGTFANKELSAFLSSRGTINGDSAYVNIDALALNSLNNLSTRQYNTATLLENMYSNLSGNNAQRELDPLYNMSKEEAQTAFSEIYGGTQTQTVRLAPLNSGLGSSVFSRLDALPNSVNVNVNVPIKSLTAPTSADFYTSTIIPLEFDDKNSYWLKLIGGWEHINATSDFAGTKSNNFGFVMGRDYQANKNWRLGTMLAYGKANIYNALNSGKIHDYRLGIYGSYKKEALEMQTYLSFGKQDYNISRSLSSLGKTAHSDYDALSLDLGIKTNYDLHHHDKKLWQVQPYLGLNLQSSWQDAYTETGAGVFSQQVDKFNNIYSTAGLGLEISRKINGQGQYGFAVGYKRVLSGDNPELNARLIGDTSQSFRLSSIANSKNIFSVEINAEGKLKNNWSIFGQAAGEFTHKSKSGFVSISLRHSW